MIWLPDRSKHQRRVVAALYERADPVPCERRAVLAGGLRGADKDDALARAGVDRSDFFTVSVDVVLAELARRSLIPVLAGLSPLDGADLVHGEAQHVAKRLAARAIADGRNLLLDVTMGSQPSVQSWLVNLGLAKYTVQVVTAPLSGPDAVRWALAEHRRGYELYLAGAGDGGRYVPDEAILLAAELAESIAVGTDWDAVLRHVHGQARIAFPGGDLFTLAQAYGRGDINRAQFVRKLCSCELARVPATCPPGLEQARAALDDLEPWGAGSLDEIVLACDLDILADDDYQVLVEAVTA